MRKILENSHETKEYLDKLPKIYLVACWAGYGVREFPFAGKFIKDEYQNNIYVPLVYDYDDFNGTCDNWYLRKITNTTTGQIVLWTQDESVASKVAKLFNKELEEKCLNG